MRLKARDVPVYSSPAHVHNHPDLTGDENAIHRQRLAFGGVLTHFVVGIPLQSFLDTFFPVPAAAAGELLETKSAFESVETEPRELPTVAPSPGGQVSAYTNTTQPKDNLGEEAAAFCIAFANAFENLKLCQTHSRVDKPSQSGSQPDLSVYSLNEVHEATPPDTHTFSGHRSFVPLLCELFVQCRSISREPFTKVKTALSRLRHQKILWQMAYYAMKIMSCQHRTHLYLVLSFPGNRFRIFRWDPAGVLVTKLETGSALLTAFSRRFDRASPAARGLDPTVAWAASAQETIFSCTLESYGRDQLELAGNELEKFVEKHYEVGNVAVMMVANEWILISRPTCTPPRPVGRCTRGYLGVQAMTDRHGKHRVGFVKESWLSHGASNKRAIEGEVISTLRKRGLLNMPEYVIHGYVSEDPQDLSHTTKTNRYVGEYGVHNFEDNGVQPSVFKSIPHPHRHYRLFTTLYGPPLTEFRDGEELVNIVGDVLLSIIDSFRKNRLHRDVSMGNVILLHKHGSRNRTGALIDWGYSSDVHGHEAGDDLRIGTRVFMSAMMLKSRPKRDRHTIFDDIESLSYVFLLICIQWMAVEEGSVQKLIEARTMLFDSRDGIYKAFHLSDTDEEDLIQFCSPPIQKLWTALWKFTSVMYVLRRGIWMFEGMFDAMGPKPLDAIKNETLNLDLD